MFGRQVTAAFSLPLPARLTPSLHFQCRPRKYSRPLFPTSCRFYATPGRPRTAVGEPSKPVKRSVKKAATKISQDPDSAAVKHVQKKKASATKKEKKVQPKKPKKKVPKELTEKQIAAKNARTRSEKIKSLKAIALQPPKVSRNSAWIVFSAEKFKGETKQSSDGTQSAQRERLSESVKATAAAWKSLKPAELEHYNHLARTQAERSQAEYKRYVESHSVDEIEAANRARLQLNRLYRKPDSNRTVAKYPLIKDERHVKRPVTGFLLFCIERQKSGDFAHIHSSERSKLVAQEWKVMSEDEKKKYEDLYQADKERYNTEYEATHGRAPGSPIPATSTA